MATTRVAQLDRVVQRGRGVAASVLGQTLNVYRLSNTSNVSVTAGSPVITGFQARLERTTSKRKLESETINLITYVALCDNGTLQIGDLLETTGYKSDGAWFYFVQARPLDSNIFIRAELAATITRPMPTAGAASQMGTGPQAAPSGTWGGVDKGGEQVLTLVNGLYSFSGTIGATPATVMCGLQPRPGTADRALHREVRSLRSAAAGRDSQREGPRFVLDHQRPLRTRADLSLRADGHHWVR
jgi:hypothetical protein